MPNHDFIFPRELYELLGQKIIESIESDDFNGETTHFVALDLGFLPSETGHEFEVTVVEIEEDDDLDFNNVDIDFNDIDLDNLEDVIIKKAKIPKRKLLAHLPTYRRIKEGDDIIGDSCPICQESFKMGEYKRKLVECSHVFHKKCVDRWLCDSKMECPLCRTGYELEESENENGENENDVDEKNGENENDVDEKNGENENKDFGKILYDFIKENENDDENGDGENGDGENGDGENGENENERV